MNCPNCGYCPHCGRGNDRLYPTGPYEVPYRPYERPSPKTDAERAEQMRKLQEILSRPQALGLR